MEARPDIGDDFRVQKARIADYLTAYGADVDRVLEIACGTGEFTAMAAELTKAGRIVATDISEHALRRAGARVDHPGLELVQGDFWTDDTPAPAPLVMCVDAIHHLGDVRQVLKRMSELVEPGGTFIGNLWTLDNFHEYQRSRNGPVGHLGRCALFLANALAMNVSRGRLRWASYRTQLLRSRQVEPLLRETFDEVLDVTATRYFVAFACRRAG
ncbi:class I SAM-dependent methyltransferase [Amycolatopsis sp. A133]|uniref:class I SAM-dependent methyltransferase n=1 Tax=Amycolatopsis sp. A133 TaxID=3064472 RepID=UPI0027EB8216|nr:class I SAM-dependent methyltransferase [Amycolatopsis sp. A133]MDQ7803519.1 class I SAM-dependent methyltransferase [Amycolatopsis sp. A133]